MGVKAVKRGVLCDGGFNGGVKWVQRKFVGFWCKM